MDKKSQSQKPSSVYGRFVESFLNMIKIEENNEKNKKDEKTKENEL